MQIEINSVLMLLLLCRKTTKKRINNVIIFETFIIPPSRSFDLYVGASSHFYTDMDCNSQNSLLGVSAAKSSSQTTLHTFWSAWMNLKLWITYLHRLPTQHGFNVSRCLYVLYTPNNYSSTPSLYQTRVGLLKACVKFTVLIIPLNTNLGFLMCVLFN